MEIFSMPPSFTRLRHGRCLTCRFSDSVPEDRQIQEKEQRQSTEHAPHCVQPPPACEQALRFG